MGSPRNIETALRSALQGQNLAQAKELLETLRARFETGERKTTRPAEKAAFGSARFYLIGLEHQLNRGAWPDALRTFEDMISSLSDLDFD